jgi:hypothetical protein
MKKNILLPLYLIENNNIDIDIDYDNNQNNNNENNNNENDDNDDEYMNITNFKKIQEKLRRKNDNDAYEDHEKNIIGSDNIKNFREYVKNGLEKFKNNDINGSINDLIKARNYDNKQPLMQLGIFLYINQQYEEAEKQLFNDIMIIENAKISKASELRLWRCASLTKLNKLNDAKKILNEPITKNLTNINEDRYIMNITMNLFNNNINLEKIMELIENRNEYDITGFRFYGNFYTALYLDSINDNDLCKTFLSFAIGNNPSSNRDIWYHLPRMFYKIRYGNDDFIN